MQSGSQAEMKPNDQLKDVVRFLNQYLDILGNTPEVAVFLRKNEKFHPNQPWQSEAAPQKFVLKYTLPDDVRHSPAKQTEYENKRETGLLKKMEYDFNLTEADIVKNIKEKYPKEIAAQGAQRFHLLGAVRYKYAFVLYFKKMLQDAQVEPVKVEELTKLFEGKARIYPVDQEKREFRVDAKGEYFEKLAELAKQRIEMNSDAYTRGAVAEVLKSKITDKQLGLYAGSFLGVQRSVGAVSKGANKLAIDQENIQKAKMNKK